MDVEILEFVSGARRARGTAVIIDVLRASSVECALFSRGVERIIPVDSVGKALALKHDHPEFLLVGERDYHVPKGFDYGNSPCIFMNKDLTGSTVIHSSSAGTKCILGASKSAGVVLVGCFLNARATVAKLLSGQSSQISLVACGVAGKIRADEDVLCAEYMRDLLSGKKTDFHSIVKQAEKSQSAKIFFDTGFSLVNEDDFRFSLREDVFDFAIVARKDEEFGVVLEAKR